MAETQTAPGYQFPTRVLSLPIVSSSIDTVHSTLSSSPYTQRIYATSTSIATTAYSTASSAAAAAVSSPVGPHLQAGIALADNYASRGLDLVESKFSYPLHSTPEVLYGDLKKAPEHAREAARKTIDERIYAPAAGLATSVDQSLAPLVDALEALLVRLHARDAAASSDDATSSSSAGPSSSPIARAKTLLFDAKDHLVTITAEQAKALQEQNVYIQRASEHARSINATLATYREQAQAGIEVYKGKGVELQKDAQARIHTLSSSMLAELEKIQASTQTLPSQLQANLEPLTAALSSTATELRTIIVSEAPLSDKAQQLAGAVQARVTPVVEQGREIIKAVVEKYTGKKPEEVVQEAESKVNGTY